MPTDNPLNPVPSDPPRRVLLTGVSGFVGRATLAELLAHGYHVRGLDRTPFPREHAHFLTDPRFEMVYANMTDRLALLSAATGCDAIIHLAAVPHPLVSNPEDILTTNVAGTGHLLEAAERFGIKRFALASSCCAFGFYFALQPFLPDYLPLDEKHPARPHDLYGLSKHMGEQLCAAYTTRCGMTTVALRLTTVRDYAPSGHRDWLRHRLSDTHRKQDDFWTYIETRDCARAFRLAIETAPEGTNETLIIANRDSFSLIEMGEQIARHFPALSPFVADLDPSASVYDTRLAESHMGFVAQNSWRDLPEFAGETA